MAYLPALVAVVLLAGALMLGVRAFYGERPRTRLLRGGLAALCVLAAAGAVIWTLRPPGPAPVPASLTIYYIASASDGPTLYAVRARDGTVRWEHLLTANYDSLYLRGCQDGVLTLNGIGNPAQGRGPLVLLRAADGSEMWHTSTVASAAVEQLHASGALGDSVQSTLNRGVMYVRLLPDAQATVVAALRASDGRILWKVRDPHPLDDLTASNLEATNVLDTGDGNLYVAPGPNRVIAYRATDGTRLWERTLAGDAGRYDNLVTGPGAVYAASASGRLIALRASDGTILWQITQAPPPSVDTTYGGYGVALTSSGLLITHLVDYSIARLRLSAVRASDGTRVWDRSLPGSGPFLDGTALFVSSDSGPNLDELRMSDGQTVGQAWINDIIPQQIVDGLVIGSGYVNHTLLPVRGPINTIAADGARSGIEYWSRSIPELDGRPIAC